MYLRRGQSCLDLQLLSSRLYEEGYRCSQTKVYTDARSSPRVRWAVGRAVVEELLTDMCKRTQLGVCLCSIRAIFAR
jgi:hypothetical protein